MTVAIALPQLMCPGVKLLLAVKRMQQTRIKVADLTWHLELNTVPYKDNPMGSFYIMLIPCGATGRG